jgi:hypothetical protein
MYSFLCEEQKPSNNNLIPQRDTAARIRNMFGSEKSLPFGASYGGFSPESSTDFV